MRKHHRVLIKIFLILSTIPIVIWGYASGPEPNVTGAPGDQTCIQSGCHTGTANSGPGNVKILLPSGNSGTYSPGQPMQLTVQITDTTKRSYGFELTARSGTAFKTQAGTFSPTDAFTQLTCLTPDPKTFLCPANSPDIEHSQAGWMNSVANGKSGSYSYTFTWTPPATNVGDITLYVAANCGSGTDNQLGTDVYLANMKLTASAAAAGPTISNVQDAASFRTSVVPGSWVAIFGSGLANTSRVWALSDFQGNNLPSSLDGVSVNFGSLPASVFYISSTQIDVQAPSGISGTVPVTVNNNGKITASFNATVVGNSPSLFTYPSGSNTFPAATHVNGQIIGDPSVTPGTAKALPGETIVLYVNAIAASPSGTLISAPIAYSDTVTVNVGSATTNASFAGLVAAGEYQINVPLPSGLSPGVYPISIQTAGQTSQTGVAIAVGP